MQQDWELALAAEVRERTRAPITGLATPLQPGGAAPLRELFAPLQQIDAILQVKLGDPATDIGVTAIRHL
jgi:hypothetical protein